MQDNRNRKWGRDLTASTDAGNDAANDAHDPNSAPVDGWQQYRRWISKAPAPHRRRNGVDPSLYTWKGYRDWTEQIKRNWSEKS